MLDNMYILKTSSMKTYNNSLYILFVVPKQAIMDLVKHFGADI
jgi:hypothetical protein